MAGEVDPASGFPLPDAPGDFSETVPNKANGGNPFTPLTPAQEADERARLNFQAGRASSLAGASAAGTAAQQTTAPSFTPDQVPGGGDLPKAPFGVGSDIEMNMVTDPQQEQAKQTLEQIQADQLAYKSMPSYSGIVQGAVSLGAQLAGGATSPENIIFPEIKMGSALWRATHPLIADMVSYGLGQAVIQGAVDPLKQAAELKAGLRREFDPVQTSLAIPVGFAFGAGITALNRGLSILYKSGVDALAGRLTGELPTLTPEIRPVVQPEPPKAPIDVFEPKGPSRTVPLTENAPAPTVGETPPLAEGMTRLFRADVANEAPHPHVAFTTQPAPNANAFIDVPDNVAAAMQHGDRVVLPEAVASQRQPLPPPPPPPPPDYGAVTGDQPKTLTQFLRSRGGLQSHDELTAIYGRTKLDLIRKKGMTLDQAREAAVEAGYLHDHGLETGGPSTSTPNDLLNALADEDKGVFHYPRGQEGNVRPRDHAYEAAQADVDALFSEIQLEPTGENRDLYRRTIDIVYREGVEPDIALDHAIAEEEHYAEHLDLHQRIEENAIPFDHGTTSEAGGANDQGGASVGEVSGTRSRSAGGVFTETQEGAIKSRLKGMAGQTMAAPPGSARPGAGVASAHATGDLPPLENLQDAMRRIADGLELTVRKGVHRTDSTGTYNFSTEMIRLAESGPDAFITFAHELGHHVEDAVGRPITTLIGQNAQTLRPFGGVMVDNMKPSEATTESFAEFMAAYLTNRARAELIAPSFVRDFRDILEQRAPDLLRSLDEANAAWERFQQAPSRTAVESMIVSHTEMPKEDFRDPLQRGPIALWASNIYREYVNRQHPMAVALRYLAEVYEQKFGKLLDLPPDKDPAKILQIFGRGGHQMSVMDMTYGVQNAHTFQPEGPSFFSILRRVAADPVTGAETREGAAAVARLKAFDAYLTARWHRALRKQMSNGEIDLARPPTPMTDGDAARVIAETETLYPKYALMAEEVYAYNKLLLKKELDANLRTKESFDELMLPRNHEYVPLRRDMTDITETIKSSGGTFTGQKGLETLSRFARQGSARNILSPTESFMLRNFTINDQMVENWMKLAIRDLVRLVGGKEGARIAEEIPNTALRSMDVDIEDAIYRAARANNWLSDDARDLAREVLTEIGPTTRVQLYRAEAIKAGTRPIIFGWDQGERFALQLPDGDFGRQLQEVIDSVGPKGMNSWAQASGLLFNILSATSGTLRSGATGTPTFMAKNIVRDAFMQYLLLPEADTLGTLSLRNAIRGGASYLTGDDFYRMYVSMEGIRGGLTAQSINPSRTAENMYKAAGLPAHAMQNARAELAAAANKAGIPSHKAIYASQLKDVLSAMEISESAGRIGVFRAVYEDNIRMNRDPRYAMFDAAQKARDFIDYSRYGSNMELTSRLVPFLNANIQGIDKFVRTYAGTPTSPGLFFKPKTQQQADYQQSLRQALIPRVAAIAAISAGITYAYEDDPAYQRIPVQQRSQYWIFRVPFIKSGAYSLLGGGDVQVPEGMQGAWMFVPKPWEPGTIFNMAEKAVEFVNSGDPEHIAQFLASTRYTFSVPNLFEFPLVRTTTGLASNYDTFFQRPIVPDSLQRVAPHLQANEYTNKFYVALAQGLNMVWNSKDAHDFFRNNIPVVGALLAAPWSPMEAQYLMQGVFGDWPRELGGIGGITRSLMTGQPVQMQDIPAVRAFIKDKMAMGEPMNELYNQVGQNSGRLSIAASTFKKFITDGDPTSAQTYFSSLDQNQRDYVRVHNADGGPIANVMHPLDRTLALASVTRAVKNGLLSDNGLATVNDPNVRIKLEPGQRDAALQVLNEYTATEARNALIVQGAPGYKTQPIVNTKPYLDMIEKMSPDLFRELSGRLAQKKVMPIETIQQYWPQMQRELRVGGDPAQLSTAIKGIGFQAAAQGYEGGGMKSGRGATDSSGMRVKRGKALRPELAGEGATQ